MTSSDRQPQPSAVKRTVRRIVAEAICVAIIGGLVGGMLWEIPFPGSHITGLVLACAIWIAGIPSLEVVRLMQSNRQEQDQDDLPL